MSGFWAVSPSHAMDLQDARQKQRDALRAQYMPEVLKGLAQNPAVITSPTPTKEELESMRKLAHQIVDAMLPR